MERIVEEVKEIKKRTSAKDKHIKELEERLKKLESLEIEVKQVEENKSKDSIWKEVEVIYQKVKFRRFDKPGICLDFLYDLKQYQLPDQCEVELKKEVVDHLNSLVERVANGVDGHKNTLYIERPRFSCVVSSESVKTEKVRIKK